MQDIIRHFAKDQCGLKWQEYFKPVQDSWQLSQGAQTLLEQCFTQAGGALVEGASLSCFDASSRAAGRAASAGMTRAMLTLFCACGMPASSGCVCAQYAHRMGESFAMAGSCRRKG